MPRVGERGPYLKQEHLGEPQQCLYAIVRVIKLLEVDTNQTAWQRESNKTKQPKERRGRRTLLKQEAASPFKVGLSSNTWRHAPLKTTLYLPHYRQMSPSSIHQKSMRSDLFTVNVGELGTTQQVNKVKVEHAKDLPRARGSSG